MRSEPGPSVQPRVQQRRRAPLDRREDQHRHPAEEPDRRSQHGARRQAPWEDDLRTPEGLRLRLEEAHPGPSEEAEGIAQTLQLAPTKSLRALR
jgi:hypothetical protein